MELSVSLTSDICSFRFLEWRFVCPFWGAYCRTPKSGLPASRYASQYALRESYCFPGKEECGRQEYSPPHSWLLCTHQLTLTCPCTASAGNTAVDTLSPFYRRGNWGSDRKDSDSKPIRGKTGTESPYLRFLSRKSELGDILLGRRRWSEKGSKKKGRDKRGEDWGGRGEMW